MPQMEAKLHKKYILGDSVFEQALWVVATTKLLMVFVLLYASYLIQLKVPLTLLFPDTET